MRILHLEDQPLDADLARRALVAALPGCAVEVAPTLAAARERLEAGGFDLLLADLHLPDGHGIELIVEVRSRALPVAIVALTGAGEEPLALATLKAGADDYLAKNDDYAQRLPATVTAALRRFRAAQARHARPLAVLYVEHQDADVDLTRRHLQAHAPHIRLDAVPDAAAALARLPAAGEPAAHDVLLVDYRLPGLDGLELLKTVREDRGLDLPVVVVTGQGSEDVAVQALHLGATDYVVKHDGYLLALPATLEGAVHRVDAERERAGLERRVAERTAELEDAKRELEAFTYSAAHELRAPLRAIDGLVALLQKDHDGGLDDEGRRLLGLLRGSVARLDRLVVGLLEFARSTRQSAHLTEVQPAPLVRHCLDDWADEIRARGIEVAVGDLPPCRGDPLLLRPVFANLIGNAVKYTRGTAAPRIEVDAQAGADGVVYRVRDNGCGFDMAQAGQLFTVFHRLHRADEYEGTGVGLAIVQRLVQRLGGRVWANARPGQGATFSVALPAP